MPSFKLAALRRNLTDTEDNNMVNSRYVIPITKKKILNPPLPKSPKTIKAKGNESEREREREDEKFAITK